MTVGDKGVVIVADAGGYDMTGATTTLLAAPGSDPNALSTGIRLSPMTVAGDGLTSSYKTTGTDLQESGPWQVMLEVQTAAGEVFTSPPGSIYVNPLIKT